MHGKVYTMYKKIFVSLVHSSFMGVVKLRACDKTFDVQIWGTNVVYTSDLLKKKLHSVCFHQYVCVMGMEKRAPLFDFSPFTADKISWGAFFMISNQLGRAFFCRRLLQWDLMAFCTLAEFTGLRFSKI